MTFEEALKAMRKGEKVRREIWGKNCYIRIGYVWDENNIEHETFVTGFNNEVNVSRMIKQNDWEIVDNWNIGNQCARPFDETTNAFYFKYKDEIIRVWKSDFYSYFKKTGECGQ